MTTHFTWLQICQLRNDSTPDHGLQTNTRGLDSDLKFTMFEVTEQRRRATVGRGRRILRCWVLSPAQRRTSCHDFAGNRNSKFSSGYTTFSALLPDRYLKCTFMNNTQQFAEDESPLQNVLAVKAMLSRGVQYSMQK